MTSLKIISWNVNSVRARAAHLDMIIKEEMPDILLLQETKCEDHNFPHELFQDHSYNVYHIGQKSRNGVAVLSRILIEEKVEDEEVKALNDERFGSRYAETVISVGGLCMRVISVYVPNGGRSNEDEKSGIAPNATEKFQAKMAFFELLEKRLVQLIEWKENIIIGGDFNVAHQEIDVFDAKIFAGHIGFLPEERRHLNQIINNNMLDLFRLFNGNKQLFSWWDYRKNGYQNNRGMRIDYIFSTPAIADKITDIKILSRTREWDAPSDHAPVSVTLTI